MKRLIASLLLLTVASVPSLWAGLTANLNIYRSGPSYFYFVSLATNATAPDAPVGDYLVVSPQYPTNGTYQRYTLSAGGLANLGASASGTTSFDTFMNGLTNGQWQIVVTNISTTNIYFFTVNADGYTPAHFPQTVITFPTANQSNVTNQPTVTWAGPVDWQGTLNAQVYNSTYTIGDSSSLPPAATSWTPSITLANDTNSVYVYYRTNTSSSITLSTPEDAGDNPLSAWTSTSRIETFDSHNFRVGSPAGSGGAALFGHYQFDNPGNLTLDSSGLGNHATSVFYTGAGTQFPQYDPVGVVGGAIEFDGYNAMFWENDLTNVVRGCYSISLWLKTTQTYGLDNDSAFDGAGIVDANNPKPMIQTGSKLAFETGFGAYTLYSTASINSGDFTHLVVTRDAATGDKYIYVNGVLNASESGDVGLAPPPSEVRLGYSWSALLGLEGVVDDMQVYTSAVTGSQVSFLYNNPGSTIPDTGGGNSELAEAVDAPQLTWTTGGDGNWFRQTTETHDSVDAAQSGAIDHDAQSWIETTVEGPGVFSFWWNVSSDDSDGYDFLELTVDGFNEMEISGDWGWDYYEVYLGSGTHTLRWTYHKDGDFTAGQDAAWLDEALFAPELEVDLTLQIERNNDPTNPGFFAYPTLDYFSPLPITSHEVESPTGKFGRYVDATDNYAFYDTLPTLQAVLDELEAGQWRLYLNRGHASERQYTFTVTVNSLDATNLPAAHVTSPTEWQTDIATNHTFVWSGPTNYDSLFCYSYVLATGSASGGFTNLNAALTASRMPNPLLPGTNAVYLNYADNGFDGVTLSDPVDSSFNSLSSWYYQVNLTTVQTRRFVVGSSGPPAAPVQILSPLHTGTNFSLSFLTQSGHTHRVQSRTNLSTAPWVDLTNFVGNGTPVQLFLPTTESPETYFRVGTE